MPVVGVAGLLGERKEARGRAVMPRRGISAHVYVLIPRMLTKKIIEAGMITQQ